MNLNFVYFVHILAAEAKNNMNAIMLQTHTVKKIMSCLFYVIWWCVYVSECVILKNETCFVYLSMCSDSVSFM